MERSGAGVRALEENRWLKQTYAKLSLAYRVLKDVVEKSYNGRAASRPSQLCHLATWPE